MLALAGAGVLALAGLGGWLALRPGEAPVPGVTGKTFLNVVTDHGHPHAVFVPRRIDVVPHMLEMAEPGDLVITMGAGDIYKTGEELVELLNC